MGGDGGGARAGLTRPLGVAPGPANGFTLDLIDCFERFGALIDWAMVILSPMEPWPGELVLDAAAANDVKLITRVVDYGGLFQTTCARATRLPNTTTASSAPRAGWRRGEKLEQMRPYRRAPWADAAAFACQWNLAHPAVAASPRR